MQMQSLRYFHHNDDDGDSGDDDLYIIGAVCLSVCISVTKK